MEGLCAGAVRINRGVELNSRVKNVGAAVVVDQKLIIKVKYLIRAMKTEEAINVIFTPGLFCTLSQFGKLSKVEQKNTLQFLLHLTKHIFESVRDELPESTRSKIDSHILKDIDAMMKPSSPASKPLLKGGAVTRKLSCVERKIEEKKAASDSYKHAKAEVERGNQAFYNIMLQLELKFEYEAQMECKSRVGPALLTAGKATLGWLNEHKRTGGAAAFTGLFVWALSGLGQKGAELGVTVTSGALAAPVASLWAVSSGLEYVFNSAAGVFGYGGTSIASSTMSAATRSTFNYLTSTLNGVGDGKLTLYLMVILGLILFLIVSILFRIIYSNKISVWGAVFGMQLGTDGPQTIVYQGGPGSAPALTAGTAAPIPAVLSAPPGTPGTFSPGQPLLLLPPPPPANTAARATGTNIVAHSSRRHRSRSRSRGHRHHHRSHRSSHRLHNRNNRNNNNTRSVRTALSLVTNTGRRPALTNGTA